MIMKKLFWSCSPEVTRFGYKRRSILYFYPTLCQYYDEYFYTNEFINSSLHKGKLKDTFAENDFDNISEDQVTVDILSNSEDVEISEDRIDDMEKLTILTEMNSTVWKEFNKLVLQYCIENLAKVEMYIPSPFVSKFKLDEVKS